MHSIDFRQMTSQRSATSHLDSSDGFEVTRGLDEVGIAGRLSGVLHVVVGVVGVDITQAVAVPT